MIHINMIQFLKRIFRRGKADAPSPKSGPESAEPVSIGVAENPAGGEYSGDQPIGRREQDRFNRWTFADRVARTLAERKDSSSVVIGIYGAWGDGKTSTLRLMQEALKAHPNVVHLTFNPWQFESQEHLLRSFFYTMAAGLGRSLPTRKEELGKILNRYGKVLSILTVGAGPVTIGAGDAAQGLGEALSAVELDELRERLERVLRESGKRVVVFIDDIDRLDRTEIQAVFKLVKLSAGFDHTSYVLAFDDEMVAAALGEKYGGGGSESGRSFLEKIVQVPLHLPPADEVALRKFTFEGVDAALKLAGIELGEAQIQAFVRHFVDGLEPRLTTPRQARLYGNVLAFALPILKGEVNPVDQMLIEGVRIFYPKLYIAIRDNRGLFMVRRGERGRDDSKKRQALELIDAALVGTGMNRDTLVQRFLKVLFPRIETLLGNTTYGDDWDKRWDREQRICSEHYSDRYFRYSVPPGDVSDLEVEALIERAQTASDVEVEEELKRIAGADGMRKLITKLRHREDSQTPAAGEALAIALSRLGTAVPREKGMLMDDWTLSQAAILILKLLRRLPAGAERQGLALRVVAQAEPLPFAAECMRWLRYSKEEMEAERTLSAEQEEECGRAFAARIREAAQKESLYVTFGPDTPRLLYFWQKYGEPDEVSAYLRGRLEADPGEVDLLLDVFVGTAWGMESGLSHKADLARDNYDSIARLLDPQVILEKLQRRYPGLSGEEYPYDGDNVARRIAEQFAFVHRKAVEKAGETKTDVPGPDSEGESVDD